MPHCPLFFLHRHDSTGLPTGGLSPSTHILRVHGDRYLSPSCCKCPGEFGCYDFMRRVNQKNIPVIIPESDFVKYMHVLLIKISFFKEIILLNSPDLYLWLKMLNKGDPEK